MVASPQFGQIRLRKERELLHIANDLFAPVEISIEGLSWIVLPGQRQTQPCLFGSPKNKHVFIRIAGQSDPISLRFSEEFGGMTLKPFASQSGPKLYLAWSTVENSDVSNDWQTAA